MISEALRRSYELHASIESPRAFLRREWPAIAVFGGAFVAVLLAAIFTVDAAYFYPRLHTDPLLYYLKALTFAEEGHTAARTAVNAPPFMYVPLPGLLRAPFLMAFSEFDHQLRAIQVANIGLLTATGLMFAYVFSWAVPASRHWLVIGFAFGSLLLTPAWVENMISPMAEAPYAAFTTAVIILSVRILASDRSLRTRKGLIAMAIVLFIAAFFVKFTALALLLFAGALAGGRAASRRVSPRDLARAAVAPALTLAVLLTVLFALSWDLISSRYVRDPIGYLARADASGILMNLVSLAIPSQLIPGLHLGFIRQPLRTMFNPVFGTNPADFALTGLGCLVTAVVAIGIWRSRKTFLPEIIYYLVPLPLLAILMTSTARYLMTYQALAWIFFYVGAAYLLRPLRARLPSGRRTAVAAVALLLVAAGGLLLLRTQRLSSSAGPAPRLSLGETRGHAREVASTYRSLRNFLETLPRERTLLIAQGGTVGRWKVIADVDYYRANARLAKVASRKEVYVLLECERFATCSEFGFLEERTRARIMLFGPFEFDSVFSAATPYAMAKVYRLRPGAGDSASRRTTRSQIAR